MPDSNTEVRWRWSFWWPRLKKKMLPGLCSLAVLGLLWQVFAHYEKKATDERHRVEDFEQRAAEQQVARADRAKDQQRYLEETTPTLLQRGDATYEGDFTFVTFQNEALSAPAILYPIEFHVTDPHQLAVIARVHPRPKGIGASVDTDAVYFKSGVWHGDNRYVFECHQPLETGKRGALCFKMLITDPKLNGHTFDGRVRVYFSPEEYLDTDPLHIECRTKLEKPTGQQQPIPTPRKNR